MVRNQHYFIEASVNSTVSIILSVSLFLYYYKYQLCTNSEGLRVFVLFERWVEPQ